MKTGSAVWTVFALTQGCADSYDLALLVDLPSEIEGYSVVLETGSNAILGTRIYARGERAEIPDLDADYAAVLGFTEQKLRQLTEAEKNEPLRPAETSDPLVVADLLARGRIEGRTAKLEVSNDHPPNVTASWATGCRTLLPRPEETVADIQCTRDRCAPETSEAGCRLSIDVSSCFLGQIDLQVDGRGQIEVSSDQLKDCVAVPQAELEDRELAVRCSKTQGGSCSLSFYRPPFSADFADPPRVILDLGGETQPGAQVSGQIERGHFGGVAFLEDQLIISQLGEYDLGRDCQSSIPGTIHLFDADTFDFIQTATAPPCLTELVRDPLNANRFLATFLEPTSMTIQIGRFESDGRLVEHQPLNVPNGVTSRIADITPLGGDGASWPPLAVVTGSGLERALPSDGRILALRADLTTAYEIDDLALGEEPVGGPIAADRQGRIVVLDDGDDGVIIVDFESNGPGLIESIPLSLSCGRDGIAASGGVPHPASNGFVLVSRDPGPEVHALADGVGCQSSRIFDQPGEVTALAYSDASPDLLYLALESEQGATLERYSVSRARVLAGSTPLGGTSAESLWAYRDGLLALLPRAGQVVFVPIRGN